MNTKHAINALRTFAREVGQSPAVILDTLGDFRLLAPEVDKELHKELGTGNRVIVQTLQLKVEQGLQYKLSDDFSDLVFADGVTFEQADAYYAKECPGFDAKGQSCRGLPPVVGHELSALQALYPEAIKTDDALFRTRQPGTYVRLTQEATV
jgi:hypothetical protein